MFLAGFTYQACLGLSDMLVTGLVMPASETILLSEGEWFSIPLCHGLQTIAETSVYSYSIQFVVSFKDYIHPVIYNC